MMQIASGTHVPFRCMRRNGGRCRNNERGMEGDAGERTQLSSAVESVYGVIAENAFGPAPAM